MEGMKHHHWKIWLTLIVIAGIAGLVFYTGTGKKTLEFFKIGYFTKPASGPTKWFTIALTSEKDAFYSQAYLVSNSTFTSTGVCQQTVTINEVVLQRQATRCNVTVDNFKGKFDYTSAGSIIVSGESDFIAIDDSSYSSSKPINIRIEVIPFDFMLTNLVVDSIDLSSVTGDIVRLKDDASVKDISYLSKGSIDISNFGGYLKLEAGTVKLVGSASAVKGQDFSW